MKPEPTIDCCEYWARLAPTFVWFVFEDWPDRATMPSIKDIDGQKLRVNNCPVCGAPRRDTIADYDKIKSDFASRML